MNMWIAVLYGQIGGNVAKDRFVLAPLKREYTENKKGEAVRINKEAYNTLVDMANESTMSMCQIASKAIMFAFEHLEYGYEKEEEE